MVRSALKVVPHITTNPDYHKYHGLGRLAIYLSEVAGQEVVIANVYGYTGGHTDIEAAQATDDIIAVVLEGIEEINQPPVHVLI